MDLKEKTTMAGRRFLSAGLPLRWIMLMSGVGLATLLVMLNPFLPQGKPKIGYSRVMAQESAKSAADPAKKADQQFKRRDSNRFESILLDSGEREIENMRQSEAEVLVVCPNIARIPQKCFAVETASSPRLA
jgi:hypothetical protein